jgi:cytochrome c oxidase assembly factor CtaG
MANRPARLQSRAPLKLCLYVFVLGSLIIISFQDTVLILLESDLGNHMILEHTLFFLMGYLGIITSETILKILSAKMKNIYGHHDANGTSWQQTLMKYWTGIVRYLFTINRSPFILLISAITLLIFWHVPTVFDYAVFNGKVHILQHLSFILVGMLLFLCTRRLGESLTLYLLVSSVGMMILSGLVLALANGRIYVSYTISSHNVAGDYMLAMSIAIAVICLPVYLIRRTLLHIRTITK